VSSLSGEQKPLAADGPCSTGSAIHFAIDGGGRYYLAANTGVRSDEVLGLRWRDVDLDARRLFVREAVISVACAVQIADVETGSSRRMSDLDERTIPNTGFCG
jgi:integrase